MFAKLQSLPIRARAIALGLAFGLLTMLVNSFLHQHGSLILQGVVAGVVFAALMVPYMMWLGRPEKRQDIEQLRHSQR